MAEDEFLEALIEVASTQIDFVLVDNNLSIADPSYFHLEKLVDDEVYSPFFEIVQHRDEKSRLPFAPENYFVGEFNHRYHSKPDFKDTYFYEFLINKLRTIGYTGFVVTAFEGITNDPDKKLTLMHHVGTKGRYLKRFHDPSIWEGFDSLNAEEQKACLSQTGSSGPQIYETGRRIAKFRLSLLTLPTKVKAEEFFLTKLRHTIYAISEDKDHVLRVEVGPDLFDIQNPFRFGYLPEYNITLSVGGNLTPYKKLKRLNAIESYFP